jgi:hypothetical protein
MAAVRGEPEPFVKNSCHHFRADLHHANQKLHFLAALGQALVQNVLALRSRMSGRQARRHRPTQVAKVGGDVHALSGFQNSVEVVLPDVSGRVDRAVQEVAFAVVVVGLAFGVVAEHVIGLLHSPETCWRIRVGIAVRVVKRRLLAKRLLDVSQARGTAD